MTPRPPPQPVTRAPRATHPLAREQSAAPAPSADASAADPNAGLLEDQQANQPDSRQTSDRRREVVFSTRVPADLKVRLRRYAFNHDLLVQDIVTELIHNYLREHEQD